MAMKVKIANKSVTTKVPLVEALNIWGAPDTVKFDFQRWEALIKSGGTTRVVSVLKWFASVSERNLKEQQELSVRLKMHNDFARKELKLTEKINLQLRYNGTTNLKELVQEAFDAGSLETMRQILDAGTEDYDKRHNAYKVISAEVTKMQSALNPALIQMDSKGNVKIDEHGNLISCA